MARAARWPGVLAALALAAGEESATNESEGWWDKAAFRYPGVPMTKDHCECLNWKQLYDANRIWCGEGQEFYVYSNSTAGLHKEELMSIIMAPPSNGFQHYQLHCKTILQNFDTNRCLNFGDFGWDPDDWTSTEQWCYVPFSCKELNGGGRLKGRPVSWKVCEKGKDARMRELTPKELFDGVSTMPLGSLGTVYRYSYTILTELWSDVKKKWQRREFKRLPPMLLSAIKHNVPIIIETMPYTQHILAGKKIIHNNTLWALVCMEPKPRCLQKEEEFELPADL